MMVHAGLESISKFSSYQGTEMLTMILARESTLLTACRSIQGSTDRTHASEGTTAWPSTLFVLYRWECQQGEGRCAACFFSSQVISM